MISKTVLALCNEPECNTLTNPVLPQGLASLSGGEFLQRFLVLAITVLFLAGIIIFFFTLLIGAIKWISSGGDKAQLESAQKTITHSLLGLAILLSVFAIIQLVEHLFGGVSILRLTIPTL